MNASTNMSFANATWTTNTTDLEIKQCLFVDPATWHPSFTNQASYISSIFVVVLEILTIPVVIFLNAVTLIIVAKFEALQKGRFVVLALLAVTDFLSGLISQPLFVAKELYHLFYKDVNCSLDSGFFLILTVLCGASYYQLVCLTYERYVAITDPFGYPNRITARRLVYVAVANWLIQVADVVVQATILPPEYLIFTIIISIITLLCILYWYIKIFAVIRKHNREISRQQPNVNHQSNSRNNFSASSNHKSARTAAILLGVFSLSYIPLLVDVLLQSIVGEAVRGPAFFAHRSWATFFLHLNSLFCPIIYGLRNNEFRRYFFRLFGIHTESNENDVNRPQAFALSVLPQISHQQQASASGLVSERNDQNPVSVQRENIRDKDVGIVDSQVLSVLNVLPLKNEQIEMNEGTSMNTWL